MYRFLRRRTVAGRMSGGKGRVHNSLLVIIHVNFLLYVKRCSVNTNLIYLYKSIWFRREIRAEDIICVLYCH